MRAPAVYAAIHRVAAHLAKSGLAKSQTNIVDGYSYRSIDDLIVTLAPLLAKHGICILPKVLERSASKHRNRAGEALLSVTLKVAFTISSARDGSSHVVDAYGEALDPGDKATAKAMSAAYKSAMIQVFCIPVTGAEDADATSHRLQSVDHHPEPVEGWEQWAAGIVDTVGLCETEDALNLVQERQREFLRSLSRERPELYRSVGESVARRRRDLGRPAPTAILHGKRANSSKKSDGPIKDLARV